MIQLSKTTERKYDIILTEDFSQLYEKVVERIKPSKIFIITDSNVAPLYLEQVKAVFAHQYEVLWHVFEAGEQSKTLDTISAMYDEMITRQLDRKTLVVALGGGVVGDMAGFVAATYRRGIPFIQIPTTIVAQNDSSVGGKVGVDFQAYKNMIGAFYQPILVYINLNTLKTLPKREFHAGMSEVIKHGYIADPALLAYLQDNTKELLALDNAHLMQMTYLSCLVKSDVVEDDEKEAGRRKILNFGHTIGHALETLSAFSMLHGEAVAYGMVMAAHISYQKGMFPLNEVEKMQAVCKAFGLLMPLKDYPVDTIYAHMQHDKKMDYGKLSFILLEAVGKAAVCTEVTEEEIRNAIVFTREACC